MTDPINMTREEQEEAIILLEALSIALEDAQEQLQAHMVLLEAQKQALLDQEQRIKSLSQELAQALSDLETAYDGLFGHHLHVMMWIALLRSVSSRGNR